MLKSFYIIFLWLLIKEFYILKFWGKKSIKEEFKELDCRDCCYLVIEMGRV